MRELTDEQRREIHRLAHLPQRDIARRVGVGLGSVSKTLAAPPPAKRAKPKAPPLAKSKRPVPPPAASVPAAAEGTPVERLERAVAALERAAQQAAADGDQARVVAALRAVSDVTKTIAVLTPPAAVNPNDRPDFVKAAEDCRKGWLDHLERVIADEAAP